MNVLIVLTMLCCWCACLYAQTTAPCDGFRGTTQDNVRENSIISTLQQTMVNGTAKDIANAINTAKNLRADAVGCPEHSYEYTKPNFAEPLFSDIAHVWQTRHAPLLGMYKMSCPTVGREWAQNALGAYYARQAGFVLDTAVFINIARMTEAQQYKPTYSFAPLAAAAGLYAYPQFIGMDSCNRGGVMGDGIAANCKRFPELCVQYKEGLFSGQQFFVADVKPDAGWFDGGMAFDHAWAGVMMIEAALQMPDAGMREFCKRSALLAGDWAAAEPPVNNHSYTAKVVWLLAELYNWTGEEKYRRAMLDKLDRNVLLGVLMDENNDGFVDGMKNQPFKTLTRVAQRPGRMWDGQNALPSNHAINTWALVEAYCALRDRDGVGNTLGATASDSSYRVRLKTFAVTMLDNLAWEINNLGVGSPTNPGFNQLSYALLIGIWKIAAFEHEPRPEWEKAAAALWNTGYARNFGSNTVNVGLYLLYKSGKQYIPLYQREQRTMVRERVYAQSVSLEQNTPNPFNNSTNIAFRLNVASVVSLKIYDAVGHELLTLLKNELMPAGTYNVDVTANELSSGIYAYRLFVGDIIETRFMQVMKFR